MVANTAPYVGELVTIKYLGQQEYAPVWQQLKFFTHNRSAYTTDELWVLEHAPVFTQGQAGKAEHVLNPGVIPIVQSDRGGQVTYHGPGQLIVYCLTDLQRKHLNVRAFVDILETSVIALLAQYGIVAHADKVAPGVYVNKAKICSLGLRIKHGRAYHGLSLNVAMDLEPFTRINPCGYAGMSVVQVSDFVPGVTVTAVAQKLLPILVQHIGYKGLHG